MSISKLLQKKPTASRTLIQAKVETQLAIKLRAKLGTEDVQLRQFFEAAIKEYLGEK